MSATMRPAHAGALWQLGQEFEPMSFGELSARLSSASRPASPLMARLLPTPGQLMGPAGQTGPGAAAAEYVVADTTDFYRNSEYRFGHRGDQYFVEMRQKGDVVRTRTATSAEDPALAAAIRMEEE